MALIDQDIIVILQVIVVESEIQCLEIVVFFLFHYLIDIVIENKYS